MSTDGRGNVLQVVLTKGNRNECPVLGPLPGSAVRNLGRRPRRLAADKGYSADRIRDGLVGCGIKPVIPMRDNEHVNDRDRWGAFDKPAYRAAQRHRAGHRQAEGVPPRRHTVRETRRVLPGDG